MSQATITDSIEKTLEAYFVAQFKPAVSMPVAYPNMDLDTDALNAWARFRVIWTSQTREVITGSVSSGQRQKGMVAVQVFVQRGTGPGIARRVCDHIMTLFNEVKVPISSADKIVFQNPWSLEVQGSGENEGHWYQRNVYAPFEHLSCA